ncbi:MAG: hypothetical protein SNJ64_05825 [Endomicrobiia bacterium]
MKPVFKYIFIYPLMIVILLSCNNNTKTVTEKNVINQLEDEIALDSMLIKKGVQEKLDFAIENLQLSDNMIKLLSFQNELYDESFLNSIENVKSYETSKARAINLGIYGAELNYILHFNQSQSSFRYLIVSKQLADMLGVAMAFDQKILEDYQSKNNEKDSLIYIVNSAYDNIRNHLRNGEQFQMATLVIAGSWIENMYIATRLIPKFSFQSRKPEIIDKLYQQKKYLDNIIELLIILNEEQNAYVTDITKQLATINKVCVLLEKETITNEDITTIYNSIKKVRDIIITD